MPTPRLKELYADDPATAKMLAQMLLDQLPEHAQSLEKALLLQDWLSLTKTAHSLKGMLLNLGYAEAGSLARQLEQIARHEQNEEATTLWPQLQKALTDLTTTTKNFLAE